MIPVEIQENSPRFQNFVAEESNKERKMNLDLLDEVREEARIKDEALKRRVEYKYSYKVRPRQFQVADLVMRKAHPDENKKYMKTTKDAILEGSSQQANKEAINRRNGQGPQHLKFFLLVFLIWRPKPKAQAHTETQANT